MKERIKKVKREIKHVKSGLLKLDIFRPGSLSMQYNICGNPSCRCKDVKNPQKHGPYYNLSIQRKGKNTTKFIRACSAKRIGGEVRCYKTFKKLLDKWIDLNVEYSDILLNIEKEK